MLFHHFYRFLYPIYPLICVAASAVIEIFLDLFRDKYNPNNASLLVMVNLHLNNANSCCLNLRFLELIVSSTHLQIAKSLQPLVLGLILCASHSRTFSLIHGYSAPLETYKHLEHHDDAGDGEEEFVLNGCYFIMTCMLSISS